MRLGYTAKVHWLTFETSLGRMGLGWTGRGIARFLLPSPDLEERLASGGRPAEPDRAIGALIARIVAYAEGEPTDLRDVELDLDSVPGFHRRAYAEVRQLGWGETASYGDIAVKLGDAGLARAVGQAMGVNPVPLLVPCHRVVAAYGRSGGFSAPGGVSTKMRMLALERAANPEGQFAFGF